jgi:hypothetical protein
MRAIRGPTQDAFASMAAQLLRVSKLPADRSLIVLASRQRKAQNRGKAVSGARPVPTMSDRLAILEDRIALTSSSVDGASLRFNTV